MKLLNNFYKKSNYKNNNKSNIYTGENFIMKFLFIIIYNNFHI